MRVRPGESVELEVHDSSTGAALGGADLEGLEHADHVPEGDSRMGIFFTVWLTCIGPALLQDYSLLVDWTLHVPNDPDLTWQEMASLAESLRSQQMDRVDTTGLSDPDFPVFTNRFECGDTRGWSGAQPVPRGSLSERR